MSSVAETLFDRLKEIGAKRLTPIDSITNSTFIDSTNTIVIKIKNDGVSNNVFVNIEDLSYNKKVSMQIYQESTQIDIPRIGSEPLKAVITALFQI